MSELRWVRVHNKDELESFYRGILPNIIREAKYHGYAIGVHGSLRRDLDLIAVPWTDDHSDKDDLARAIQEAACGIPQERYQWGPKPCGRVAVSFPVCWTEESEAFPGETNLGHIDLSVMLVPSQPGWISMDERAPADQAFVLVSAGTPETWQLKTTCRYHAAWVNGLTKGSAFTDASGGIIHDVSHWMPLPSPPQSHEGKTP